MLVNSLGNLKQNQTRHSKRAFKLTSVTSCILLKNLSWLKLPHTYSRCFLKSPKTTFSSQPHTLVCSCPFHFCAFHFPALQALYWARGFKPYDEKKKCLAEKCDVAGKLLGYRFLCHELLSWCFFNLFIDKPTWAWCIYNPKIRNEEIQGKS